MTTPVAEDNSGLVLPLVVEPVGFQLDVALSQSVNVTYTAHDAAGNSAVCQIQIVVNVCMRVCMRVHMKAQITLAVTSDTSTISENLFESCKVNLGSKQLTGSLFEVPAGTCGSGTNVTNGDHDTTTTGDYSCDQGRVLQDVGSNKRCGSMNYLRLVTRYTRLVIRDARLVIRDARLVIRDTRLVMRYPRLVIGCTRLVICDMRLVMGYRDNPRLVMSGGRLVMRDGARLVMGYL
nr:hypothetical protein BaRGS_008587 [Batillaria attramentaria]